MMKAYEVAAQVTPEGEFVLPATFVAQLPRQQIIRVIVLVPEPTDLEEQAAWSSLTAEQFLAGYSEADAIYDQMKL